MVLKTLDLLDTVEFDADGFMLNPMGWRPEIGEAIAAREGLELTDHHWVVINFAREEYEESGESPTMRRITTTTDVDTKEIYALFPGGPAKMACKIAGLSKPTGCI